MYIIGTLFVFVFTLLFVLNWQKHRYWQLRGVSVPSHLPLFGNVFSLFSSKRWEKIDKMYMELKSKGIWGIYSFFSPSIYITDPDLIREVLVKESDHFMDRRPMTFEQQDKVFNEMLTVVEGEDWKALRALTSPTFTSGKIKAMFPLVDKVAEDFIKECGKEMERKSFVEIKSLSGYYTMDVIASCAFGIDAHCLQNKESSPFIKNASYLVSFDFERFIKMMILMFTPKLYKFLNIQMGNKAPKFFVDVIETTIKARKETNFRRNDFLDLMLDALEKKEQDKDFTKYPMSMNTVYSESLLFLLAGFDTTSNTIAFMAYLLAKNPDCQTLLRKEMKTLVEAEGELSYQSVMEAKYLQACLAESMRLFSPAHFTERCCTMPHKLSGYDWEIPKGMMVGIPIYSLHRDPDIWEDPLAFRPERFLPENKSNINTYTYLPFGHGPRNCIGMRFAQLEAKLVIAKFVLEFDMKLRPGYEEVKLDKNITTLRPDKNGIQVVLEKITEQV